MSDPPCSTPQCECFSIIFSNTFTHFTQGFIHFLIKDLASITCEHCLVPVLISQTREPSGRIRPPRFLPRWCRKCQFSVMADTEASGQLPGPLGLKDLRNGCGHIDVHSYCA